jgi:hypothetical protein
MILDWVAGTIIIDKYEKGVNVKVIVISSMLISFHILFLVIC